MKNRSNCIYTKFNFISTMSYCVTPSVEGGQLHLICVKEGYGIKKMSTHKNNPNFIKSVQKMSG